MIVGYIHSLWCWGVVIAAVAIADTKVARDFFCSLISSMDVCLRS